MFKPHHTLLYLLIIFIFFLTLSLLPIPDSFRMAGFLIKIPQITLKPTITTTSAAAEKIINQVSKEVSVKKDKGSSQLLLNDTIMPVQIPLSFAENIYPFFASFQTESYIHVLHYGDSQIEGDRITSYLRQQFQQIKPSCGEGLIIPYKVNQISQSINISTEGNWKRYTIFGNQNKAIKHNQYGPLLQFVRFAPIFNDSAGNDSIIYEASIVAKKTNNRCDKYEKIKIWYGNLKKPVLVQLYIDNDFVEMKSLNPTLTTQVACFDIEQKAEKITIEFVGKDSPDIYALSFENDKGIFFDNIPMRGSSGTDFTKISYSQLYNAFKMLNVKLIIYQFGINVAPNNLNDYTFYENWLVSQLQYLKRSCPEASILVVGISDMSVNTDSGIVSLPSIEKIRDAQRRAAQRAKCAFWDTYAAMGGKHSMATWVKAGLASKDFTHFSSSGAQLISKMLYQAIYYELVNYQKQSHKISLNNL